MNELHREQNFSFIYHVFSCIFLIILSEVSFHLNIKVKQ